MPRPDRGGARVSNLERAATPERCAAAPEPGPAIVSYPARSTPLGEGLVVRRLLPARGRRLIGPWCFLDHYGPVAFGREARPMQVGPHPHTGLQTVSWLLEGEVLHEDSLGSRQLVRPGELSLMTAGAGISHSEATPAAHSGRLHGVQLWIALPEADRHAPPRFEHHAALPRGGGATVFLGQLGDLRSPASLPWPAVGAELAVDGALEVPLPLEHEHALLVLEGEARCEGQALALEHLHDLGRGRRSVRIEGTARLLLIGGLPFAEPVLMWWNFVARTADELAQAREDWEAGRRFGTVAGVRVPAPPLVARPVR